MILIFFLFANLCLLYQIHKCNNMMGVCFNILGVFLIVDRASFIKFINAINLDFLNLDIKSINVVFKNLNLVEI